MKKYLEYRNKNQQVVNGEEIEFNGETHIIGKMTDDEIINMRAEGTKLLQTEVTYRGNKVPLSAIKSGKDLYNITEAIELEGDFTAMWFVWREIRMAERLETLSPKAQEQIKQLTKDM